MYRTCKHTLNKCISIKYLLNENCIVWLKWILRTLFLTHNDIFYYPAQFYSKIEKSFLKYLFSDILCCLTYLHKYVFIFVLLRKFSKFKKVFHTNSHDFTLRFYENLELKYWRIFKK